MLWQQVMLNPFSLTKLAETIEKFAGKSLKIYTQIYQKILKNPQFHYWSSFHSLPLFYFRLKSHYLIKFVFFLFPPSFHRFTTYEKYFTWMIFFSFFPSACCNLSTQYLTQFRMTLDPLQSLQRMLYYCTWGLPLVWSALQSTLLTLESTWKKNTDSLKHLQKFHDFSLTFYKIPSFCPKFQFSLTFPWLEKVFLIFQVFQSEWEPCIHH